jgi:hypothetical protein
VFEKTQVFVRVLDTSAARAAAGGNSSAGKTRRIHQVLLSGLEIGAIAHPIIEEVDRLVQNALEGVIDVRPGSLEETSRLRGYLSHGSHKYKVALSNRFARRWRRGTFASQRFREKER